MEHTFNSVFRECSQRPWLRFLGGTDQSEIQDLIGRQRAACRQVILGNISDEEFRAEFTATQKPQLFWSGRFAAISTGIVHKWIGAFSLLLQSRLDIQEWELPSYLTLQLHPVAPLLHYHLSLSCRDEAQRAGIENALIHSFSLFPV
jgi:hypothetical protein